MAKSETSVKSKCMRCSASVDAYAAAAAAAGARKKRSRKIYAKIRIRKANM